MPDHAPGYPNLKRNKKGRPSRLEDPEFAQLVAELLAAGASRENMCEELGVGDRSTITKWRKDPRVKARVQKLTEDRVIQISRRVDSTIMGRLAHAQDMTVDELIKIRKEYGGSALARTEKADDDTVSDAWDKVQENPDLIKELEEVVRKGGAEAAEKD
ncbi:MAG: hypothetical protein H0T60_02515 [Acidobacteria bacterium]|nr:hypothetical protein [Acidobacteriota bacterium]